MYVCFALNVFFRCCAPLQTVDIMPEHSLHEDAVIEVGSYGHTRSGTYRYPLVPYGLPLCFLHMAWTKSERGKDAATSVARRRRERLTREVARHVRCKAGLRAHAHLGENTLRGAETT